MHPEPAPRPVPQAPTFGHRAMALFDRSSLESVDCAYPTGEDTVPSDQVAQSKQSQLSGKVNIHGRDVSEPCCVIIKTKSSKKTPIPKKLRDTLQIVSDLEKSQAVATFG